MLPEDIIILIFSYIDYGSCVQHQLPEAAINKTILYKYRRERPTCSVTNNNYFSYCNSHKTFLRINLMVLLPGAMLGTL